MYMYSYTYIYIYIGVKKIYPPSGMGQNKKMNRICIFWGLKFLTICVKISTISAETHI